MEARNGILEVFDSGVQLLRIGDRMHLRNFNDGTDYTCTGCSTPTMTPDGSQVVFAFSINQRDIEIDNHSIVAVGLDTGSRRELVSSEVLHMTHPTISPDGIWVASALQCAGDSAFSPWVSPFTVTTPACEGRRTTRADGPSATNPKWGPGVLIAYERGEPPRDLAIVAADTGDECVITGPGDDRNPSWGVATFGVPE
jgi:hypothetical protein